MAFKVDTLAELRQLHAAAPDRGEGRLQLRPRERAQLLRAGSEGQSLRDLLGDGRRSGEGNRPIDLTRSEEELLELIGA